MKNKRLVFLNWPLFTLTAGLFLLGSCYPEKQFMRQGDNLYEQGNIDGAATYYYNALLVKPELPAAKEALLKTGNQVLAGKFQAFNKFVLANESEQAIRQYLSCQKYYGRCHSVGVTLAWASMYDPIFEDLKSEWIGKKYDACIKLLQEKKYDQAEQILASITEIDSAYRGATVLRIQSILDVLYKQGHKNYQEGNFREAYHNFRKVNELDSAFKEVKRYMDSSQQQAEISLGVLPVQNHTEILGFEARIYERIQIAIAKLNNPFLLVSSRSLLELKSRDLGFVLNKLVQHDEVAKFGKQLGLKYVLMMSLNEVVFEDGPPIRDSLTAYEAISESIPGNSPAEMPQVVSRFRKVNYLNIHHKRRLKIRLAYQLVSSNTGLVVSGDEISEDLTDEFELNSYAGNINQLYLQLPINNQFPPVPKAFREQFNAVSRDLISKEELTQIVGNALCKKIIDDIGIYLER